MNVAYQNPSWSLVEKDKLNDICSLVSRDEKLKIIKTGLFGTNPIVELHHVARA